MPLSDNARAALLMMGSMAAFTVNDTFMKSLNGHLPLFQAIFLRGLVTILILGGIAQLRGQLKLRLPRRDAGLLALRSLGEAGAAYFFITALFNMPLANATAIMQTVPLAVTLAGALFLGERVGWRRMAAIVIGFGGVILIVRPGAEGFNVFALYALIAVASVTLRDLATRRMSRDIPSLTVAASGAVAVTLLGGVMSFTIDWAPMTSFSLAMLAGSTTFVMLGYMLSIGAVRLGEIGFVSPFRYTALVWGIALGLLVFGHFPDLLTLAGTAIIAATGLFTLLRERRLGAVPDPGPAPLRIR